MRDSSDFFLSYCRFGWDDEKVTDGPELELEDMEISIWAKDGQYHKCIIKGRTVSGFFDDKPYVSNLADDAQYYLDHNEYLTTIKGIQIPRCNIKHIKQTRINKRKHQPTAIMRGIKSWNMADWIFNIGPLAFVGLCIIGLTATVLYKVFH